MRVLITLFLTVYSFCMYAQISSELSFTYDNSDKISLSDVNAKIADVKHMQEILELSSKSLSLLSDKLIDSGVSNSDKLIDLALVDTYLNEIETLKIRNQFMLFLLSDYESEMLEEGVSQLNEKYPTLLDNERFETHCKSTKLTEYQSTLKVIGDSYGVSNLALVTMGDN